MSSPKFKIGDIIHYKKEGLEVIGTISHIARDKDATGWEDWRYNTDQSVSLEEQYIKLYE